MTREEAQQVLDALCRFVEYDYQGDPLDGKDVEGHEAIELLRARLSAPEPEPAGWIYEDDEGRMMFSQMPQNPPFWEPVYRANRREKNANPS